MDGLGGSVMAEVEGCEKNLGDKAEWYSMGMGE